MKTLHFATVADYHKWLNEGNDVYMFYDGFNDRSPHMILQNEVDELYEMQDRYGIDIIRQEGNDVWLHMRLNSVQYSMFCEAHCVDIVIDECLLETVAMMAGENWSALNAKCDWSTTDATEWCVSLAKEFERENFGKLYNGGDCDYMALLEDFYHRIYEAE